MSLYNISVVEKNEDGKEKVLVAETQVSARDDLQAGVALLKNSKLKQDLDKIFIKVKTDKSELTYSGQLLIPHLNKETE